MDRYYQSTVRHIVAPVMFRYMYCCGLRPIEARRMDREDVNLKTGRIFVRESKYNKERVIYAPDELLSLTRDYLGKIAAVFPGSAALFVDRKGGRLSKDAHQYLFEHCRDGSGIKESGTKRPNMYSFRHSFATHRIYQWHKDGKDISSLLPGLSAYMGHTRYQHTLYYLHFLPELFSDMAGFDLEQFSEIIPGVTGDD
jgi:integrase